MKKEKKELSKEEKIEKKITPTNNQFRGGV
jgi:hypothetical protein